MTVEPLPPAELDALVSRAKGVIAGTIPMPTLPRDERVESFMAPVGRENYKPGTIDQFYIDLYYEGQFVATYTNSEGRTAVLACGDEEIQCLMHRLTEQEARQLALGTIDLSVVPDVRLAVPEGADVFTDSLSNGTLDAVTDPAPADYSPQP